ncbi:MAG: ATP-binding protein [Bacteroidetes bacterium]|nr:ATP-binding protein [Bacteroidota bacterium]
MNPNQIHLTIPNQVAYVPLILSSVRHMAGLAGFNNNDTLRIEMAVEEAVANVIEHAFTPGEQASFDLQISRETLGISVVIKEMGIPYDFSLLPEYKKDQADQDGKGLGSFLIKNLLDEVTYVNLGKEGREIRMFKYLSDKPIDQLMEAGELALARAAMEEEVLPKGSVTYTVRRMLPREAVEVSRGAYSSYGYTYVLDHIYFPDRVRDLNERDELISFVAVTEENTVIAHAALEVEERDPLVPQLGVAFTMPKYRGQGCLNVLTPILVEEGSKKQFFALYARGITTHPYSQKSILKYGFNDCALLLSSGVEREYKGILEGKSQRESVAVLFRFLQFPDNLELFAPAHHTEIIRFIYEKLGVHPVFPEISGPLTLSPGESIVSMSPETVNKVAKLTIVKYGDDIVAQIRNNLYNLCLQRFETIYLFLPLKDPATALLTKDFEQMGFYFAGVMPGSEKRDSLILQYQNNYIVDFTKVQLASETGQRILEYIISQSKR